MTPAQVYALAGPWRSRGSARRGPAPGGADELRALLESVGA